MSLPYFFLPQGGLCSPGKNPKPTAMPRNGAATNSQALENTVEEVSLRSSVRYAEVHITRGSSDKSFGELVAVPLGSLLRIDS